MMGIVLTIFKPCSQNADADVLYRLWLTESPSSVHLSEETVLLLETLQLSTITATQIKTWTDHDPVLSQVRELVLPGWMTTLKPELQPYQCCRNELGIHGWLYTFGVTELLLLSQVMLKWWLIFMMVTRDYIIWTKWSNVTFGGLTWTKSCNKRWRNITTARCYSNGSGPNINGLEHISSTLTPSWARCSSLP